MLVEKLDEASDRSTDVPLEDLVRTQKPLEEWESEEGSVRPWPSRATRLAHASHPGTLLLKGPTGLTWWDFCLGWPTGAPAALAPQGPTVRTRTRRKATCRQNSEPGVSAHSGQEVGVSFHLARTWHPDAGGCPGSVGLPELCKCFINLLT